MASLKKDNKLDVICNINKTKNNIFITLTDESGNVLVQYSGGLIGMKGPKRNTPNAAELVGRRFGKETVALGYTNCILKVKGAFDGFVKSAVRGIQTHPLGITQIQQVRGVSHNGVRKRKQRRM